mmetsp:Transcript_13315/g.43406  ORF Transcript_13315/g.43406 Transcript_13315/m.43406 type:complete len:209 (-) Transcript_13315:436-1062(-)
MSLAPRYLRFGGFFRSMVGPSWRFLGGWCFWTASAWLKPRRRSAGPWRAAFLRRVPPLWRRSSERATTGGVVVSFFSGSRAARRVRRAARSRSVRSMSFLIFLTSVSSVRCFFRAFARLASASVARRRFNLFRIARVSGSAAFVVVVVVVGSEDETSVGKGATRSRRLGNFRWRSAHHLSSSSIFFRRRVSTSTAAATTAWWSRSAGL